MTSELRDDWSRMLRLLDALDEIHTLAPFIEREILFRLLQGPQGALLRQAAQAAAGYRRFGMLSPICARTWIVLSELKNWWKLPG